FGTLGADMWKTIGAAILCAIPLAGQGSANAQNFDGTWSGTEGCPAYGKMEGWSQTKNATIVQNQFRLETNTPTNSELLQGTVQADGRISVTGQGQRLDRPVRWSEQYSGRASSTAM